MAEYSLDYSKRKMAAVKAMVAEIEKIGKLKAEGGKALLAKHGYRGNQPKMALRGLRSFLTSEDSLFPDLLEKYEAGKLTPYGLAEKARTRTEKIGKKEVIIHSDTIHHANPLELGDAFDEMDPAELRDFLTEEYEVRGVTYGDTKQNTRGQSYTTRGHLGQKTNSAGRYKATNEFSEPGLTAMSAHPRGADDPLMKSPDVKPRTRKEAQAFVDSKASIIEESQALGAYADKDVRATVNQKMVDRGIIQPGQTVYDPNLPDETLAAVRQSLDNIPDEIDVAKSFKTPKMVTDSSEILRMYRNLTKIPGGRAAFAAIPFISDAFAAPDIAEREVKAAKTGNPVDEIQSQLAGAGQIPVLGAVPDLANAIIDNFRMGNYNRRIRGRSGAKRAQEALQQP